MACMSELGIFIINRRYKIRSEPYDYIMLEQFYSIIFNICLCACTHLDIFCHCLTYECFFDFDKYGISNAEYLKYLITDLK